MGDTLLRRIRVLSDGSKGFASTLAPKSEKPFKVVEKRLHVVFVLETGNSRRNNKVHVWDLKRFVPSKGK